MDITSFLLAKKYVDDILKGEGAIQGKSAYEIACENGFKGSPSDWLESLQGSTPQIGPNGTWIIDGFDTGIVASPSLAGYATEEYVNAQINSIPYVTQEELNEAVSKIVVPDVSDFATKEELSESVKGLATESFVESKCNEILNSIPTPPSYDEFIFDGGEI